MDLHLIWFGLLGVLLSGYAVLDGFDLGVGIVHPLAHGDGERRAFLGSIGPLWDGNEVWLVTFGGALFAAFPLAYATVFSGFYAAFMLLLFALVFRAVSIEFRSKRPGRVWRTGWDAGFFLSSAVASLLFGVGVGNAMVGLPLDERGVYTGGFVDLLNPYALLVGLLTVAMFALHGSLYLGLKLSPGALLERVRGFSFVAWGVFLSLHVLATFATLLFVPHATANFEHHPWAFAVVLADVLGLANVPRALHLGRPRQAFLSSTATILALVGLLGLGLWPNLVTASNGAAYSLTAFRASSSPGTLRTMLVIAAIGMPFVLAYTGTVYWTFRGRVRVDGEDGSRGY